MYQHGINLGGLSSSTPEPLFIDRMRLAGPVMPSTGNAAVPVGPYGSSLLPSAAGAIPRMVPFDAGTHDYVALFDANVTRISVGGADPKPVISGNRATFTVTRGPGGGGSQLTILASGQVGKFVVMRADHEKAYLAGEIFNPDLIARLAPFKLLRLLDDNATNADAFPAQRPLPSDSYFSTDRGGLPAELAGQLAVRTGAKLWYPVNHLMPDGMVTDTLRALDANSGAAAIDLEWSNEFGWTYHKDWAYAQTTARYGIAKPQQLDMLRYYGFRAGSLANLAASVGKRFRVNLSAQPSATPDKALAAILAGWDEAKAPRSLIAGFANEGYLNLNYPAATFQKLLALQAANDVDGFYALVSSLIDSVKARHVANAKACAAAGIPYKVYELNASIYSSAPSMTDATARAAFLAWVTPLVHTDRMADLLIQDARNAFDAGAVEACFYQLSGAGSQYGIWGTMPSITEAPYPIYHRLAADNAAAAAARNGYAELAAEVAAMQRQLADIQGRIAAAAIA